MRRMQASGVLEARCGEMYKLQISGLLYKWYPWTVLGCEVEQCENKRKTNWWREEYRLVQELDKLGKAGHWRDLWSVFY